ncbi:MAG: hypothetical protein ACO3FB_02945 [Candidatus Nanopelagicaceae bacterium]
MKVTEKVFLLTGAGGGVGAALAQLSDSLRSELRGTKVRVTLVFPGAMRTDIAAN